jgi:spartin
LTFSPTAQAHIRKINNLSHSAVGISSKTVGQISKYAQNLGAAVARRSEKDFLPKGYDKDGNPIYDYKPGILNKSMIAFSTIADGIEQSARNLLETGSWAATKVVGHRYGPEAATAASNLTSGAKNVGLVYIDAAGVSRKAILKSVAKGMVVGRMPDGKQLIVGADDGGQAPFGQPAGNQHLSGSAINDLGLPQRPSPTPPPAYGARDGRFLGGTPMQTEKR